MGTIAIESFLFFSCDRSFACGFSRPLVAVASAGPAVKVAGQALDQGLVQAVALGLHAALLGAVRVRPGARSNLGRPTSSPVENKKQFMSFLRN